MDLFDLPPELVSRVFTTTVKQHGIRSTVHVRLVCKRCEREVTNAIWTARLLDEPDRETTTGGKECPYYDECPRIWIDYLFQRTKTDVLRHHHYTATLYDTLDFIHDMDPSSIPHRLDTMRKACWAVSFGSPEDEQYLSNPVQRLDDNVKHCSLSENALALAASLGLRSIVDKLIQEGTSEANTYFGTPLLCVAKSKDASFIRAYLSKRLQVERAREQSLTSQPATRDSESLQQAERNTLRRNIPMQSYEDAIRFSMVHGTPETLYMIVDAAVEDAQLPHEWTYQSTPENALKTLYLAALLSAAPRGRVDMAQAALDRGADIDDMNAGHGLHRSALELAAMHGQYEMAEFLVERGASEETGGGRTLISRALCSGHIDIAELFFDAGMTTIDTSGWVSHPLYDVVVEGRPDAPSHVQMLLDRGITFELGSDLDNELAEHLARFENQEVQAVLDQYRKSLRSR